MWDVGDGSNSSFLLKLSTNIFRTLESIVNFFFCMYACACVFGHVCDYGWVLSCEQVANCRQVSHPVTLLQSCNKPIFIINMVAAIQQLYNMNKFLIS